MNNITNICSDSLKPTYMKGHTKNNDKLRVFVFNTRTYALKIACKQNPNEVSSGDEDAYSTGLFIL